MEQVIERLVNTAIIHSGLPSRPLIFENVKAAEGCPIRALNFSEDGNILATASHDFTAITWDVRNAITSSKTKQPLTNQELESLWGRLSSTDAREAYDAICRLMNDASSVSFLGEKLKPAAPLDGARIAKLVANLDHDSFEEREKAERELNQQLEFVEPTLRRALPLQTSLKSKSRLERILANARNVRISPFQLQGLRAVEVLEYIDTPQSLQILEATAKGVKDARLTQEEDGGLSLMAFSIP